MPASCGYCKEMMLIALGPNEAQMAVSFNNDADLFANFADQCRFRRFARFQSAAYSVPVIRPSGLP